MSFLNWSAAGVAIAGFGALLLALSFFGRSPSDVIHDATVGFYDTFGAAASEGRKRSYFLSWTDGMVGSVMLLFGALGQLVDAYLLDLNQIATWVGCVLVGLGVLYLSVVRSRLASWLLRKYDPRGGSPK